MPSVSPRQQRFFGAELGRKKKGLKTKTGLPIGKLKDFASAMKPNQPIAKPKVPSTPPTPKAPTLATPKTPGLDFDMAVKKPNLTGGY